MISNRYTPCHRAQRILKRYRPIIQLFLLPSLFLGQGISMHHNFNKPQCLLAEKAHRARLIQRNSKSHTDSKMHVGQFVFLRRVSKSYVPLLAPRFPFSHWIRHMILWKWGSTVEQHYESNTG
jgi:hypothetical protein